MNKIALANKLIKMAKELLAADPKMLLDELKSIEVTMAEGKMGDLDGKKFRTVADLEKAANRITKPDVGYDKTFLRLTFKDGSVLKGFRYDHGLRDDSLSDQLDWYIKNNVTMEEE